MKDSTKDKNWFKRHWILSSIGGLILLFILIGAFSGEDAGVATPSSEEIGEENVVEEEVEELYGLGDKVEVGSFAYVFNSFDRTSSIGSQFMSEEADGEYIIFEVSVENIGSESESLSDENFKLIDEQGRKHSVNMDGMFYLDDSLNFETLNPGISKDGKLVFDVPEGTENGQIKIEDYFSLSSDKAIINWE
jgi:hypothetical protein